MAVEHVSRLRGLYAAFNARDLEAVLAAMEPGVDWPNGMKGTRELGVEAVRAYWLAQWDLIDPRVDPVGFEQRPDGSVAVDVHQVIRGKDGAILNDRRVVHVYRFAGELVSRMDIEG